MNSEIVVPLLHKSRPIGALNILSRNRDQFTLERRRHRPAVRRARGGGARQCAAVRPEPSRRRSVRNARGDWPRGRVGLDLDELFARIAQLTKRVIDYRTFGILLVNEERGELEMKLAVQYGEKVEVPRVRLGEGLVGYAALHREPVLVSDVSQDPRYIKLVPDVRSELAIPLLLKDRCIGVVDLESPELDAFSKRDVEILTLLASQAAVAIENARLYEEVRANEERLEKELRFAQRVQTALLPAGPPKRLKGSKSPPRSRRRARSAATFTITSRRRRTRWSSRWATSRARASRRRSIARLPPSWYAAARSAGAIFRSLESRERALLGQHDPAAAPARGVLLHALLHRLRSQAACPDAGEFRIAVSDPLLGRRLRANRVARRAAGSFQGSTYDEVTFALHAGDLFVLCTDGVFEAMNAQGQEFTAARLIDVVAGAPRSAGGASRRRNLRGGPGLAGRDGAERRHDGGRGSDYGVMTAGSSDPAAVRFRTA